MMDCSDELAQNFLKRDNFYVNIKNIPLSSKDISRNANALGYKAFYRE